MVDIRALMLTEHDQPMASGKCSTTLEGIRENGFSTTSNPTPSTLIPELTVQPTRRDVSSTRRFVERADVHSIHLESEVMKIKLYFQEQQFDHLFALFCVKDARRDGDPSMSR